MHLKKLGSASLLGLLVATFSPAEDKPTARPQFGFLSPRAVKHEPNIEAALLLSDDQIARLEKARAETIRSPEIQALQKKSKDRSLSLDERKQAAAEWKEALSIAEVRWNTSLGTTLTADQATLITSINDAAEKAFKPFQKEYADRLKTGPADQKAAVLKERDDKARQAFREALKKVLNKQQAAAVAGPKS